VNRFTVLSALFVLALLGVVARLAQIQLAQREVWAAQAMALTSSSQVVPYHRGTLRAHDLTPLVQDEDRWQVDYVQREFRRGSALGQLAHALTSAYGQSVSYVDAAREGLAHARALLELSPADLDDFGRGAALRGFAVPAVADPRGEWRAARAGDLRFYALRFLAATREEERKLRLLRREGPVKQSYLELFAGWRSSSVAEECQLLERRFAQERERFVLLAQMLETDGLQFGADLTGAAAPQADAAQRLLERLQRLRDEREDAQADAMFQLALGFDAGRVPTRVLRDELDTQFLRRALRRSAERHAQWIATRAGRWRQELETVLVPRVLARAANERDPLAMERVVLQGLAAIYADDAQRNAVAREGLETFDEVAVLAQLSSALEGVRLDAQALAGARCLPFVDEDWQALVGAETADAWHGLAHLQRFAHSPLVDARPQYPHADLVAQWTQLADGPRGLEGDEARTALLDIVAALEDRHAEAIERVCSLGLPEASAPRAISAERIARALQHEAYLSVDIASRPVRFIGEPSYELVHRLARERGLHPGFDVRETTRRAPVRRDANGLSMAPQLLGTVGRPSLRELLAWESLVGVDGRVARESEWVGRSGIEAWLDTALRGSFGVYESQGLYERSRASRLASIAPRDGAEVVLTLDAALQTAAQETLAHPVPPPLGDDTDQLWFANPVGAIMLCTVDGAVLAAASEPAAPGLEPTPGRGRARSEPRERVFHRPGFNPPGSVFKPFVASWALDKLSYDPQRQYPCNGRFETIACNGVHVSCDLRRALVVSCNAYFAQMGLEYPPDDLVSMAREFGFGQATGAWSVAGFGAGEGWEDWRLHARLSDDQVRARLESRFDRVRFPNGLQVLEATPAQVARGMCALATGRLPDLRLVASIGGREVPSTARDVVVKSEALSFVREAMVAVVEEAGGSAHGKGLDRASLGFRLACKTGSADIGAIRESPQLSAADRADKDAGKQRKHAWVGGWFPVERPQWVVVVYLHDTTETSSRTAAWVAAQFLQHEAVRNLVKEAGQ